MNFFSYQGKAWEEIPKYQKTLEKMHLQRDKTHKEQISIEIFPFHCLQSNTWKNTCLEVVERRCLNRSGVKHNL